MNKKVLFAVLLILLLLGIGAGYWFMTKDSQSSMSATGNTQPTGSMVQEVPTTSPSRSLRDLLTAGVAQKCTFTTDNTAGSGSGTFYASGGKVRGEITSNQDGKNIVMHTIVDGNTSYVWMGTETTGFKMTMDPKDLADPSGSPQQQAIDPDQDLNYNCTPWVVDATQFTIPENVQFTDFSSLVNPAVTGGAMDKCSACNFLTGEDKTQCLSSMGCSN